MTIWRLIGREISHRKLNFAVASLSAVAAVAVLVAVFGQLTRHETNTRAIEKNKEAQTRQRVANVEKTVRTRVEALRADVKKQADDLNEDFRKITKKMGFNIFILPKDQDLSNFFSEGYAAKVMPESYAKKLATSRIVTVRHLLPVLEQKVAWPEQGDRKIVLVGTRGEVPVAHLTPHKPVLDPVEPGQIILGYELWRSLSLKVGSPVKLLGRDFTVSKCHPERGTKDDITAWIALGTAQEMLDKAGLINAIFALECSCAWADLAKVRAEITAILPDTQVKELQTQALARAEARYRVAQQGQQALARAEQEADQAVAQAIADGRREIKQTMDARNVAEQRIVQVAVVLSTLAMVGAAIWVGVLSYMNVRQRRGEVGILRAIGLRSRQIAAVVLVRAALIGLVGGALGSAVGLGVAIAIAEKRIDPTTPLAPVDPLLVVAAALTAPVLCVVAGLAPAMLAAQQDPAVVLQQEAA